MSTKNIVINTGYIASFGLFYAMYKGDAYFVLGCAAAVIGSTIIARLIK
ncbi:hypothetical protein PHG31p73 [Aeromonas phage 31]|uniref:Uncharacterized protein PHG31ORF074c n=1 Tax=Aeromonas phage 31 TaxID=321023 RepID=Q56ET8_9CAUD|nr:hypothetical protein PHG31p73 [Aeromonas phage 31]AAX63562.1 hypothetical protein PHG31p73 [Aeromonas phage 31]APU00966.1 hypothetical protein [Aeromonas phage 31.2]